jgi:DNA-binding transcriptional LysR family regulator
VQLIGRTQHGVVATRAGLAFAARARVVQSELRKVEEECAEFSGGSTGSVIFGAGPTPMFQVVPQALVQFREKRPETRVRVVEGLSPVILPMVRDETLDFALALRPVGELASRLRFRPLFRDTLAIAVRQGHPLRNARSLSQLQDAEWLAFGARWLAEAVDRVFSAAGLPAPLSVTHCETFNSVFALLASTDMIAALPHRLLMSPFGRGVLQEVPVAEHMPSNTQGIVTRADSPLTPAASEMAKLLTAAARQLARRG